VDDRTLIQQQLTLSHQFLKRCLAGVSDEDARRMPSPPLSPIVWQVGHVALVDAYFAGRRGAGAGVPERFNALFKTGTGGQADYPAFDTVVDALDRSHEALMSAAAEADLGTPSEGPLGAWKNFAEMFAFSSTHRWYHIGKITTLRALLGKPRPFG